MAIYRTVTPEEVGNAVTLWDEVFGVGREYFETLLAGDGPDVHDRLLVAEEDGKFVSSVHVFLRRQRDLAGNARKVGAIGSVCTLPEHRGKGHSYALMAQAVDLMEAYGCDYSFLFTGVHNHYAKHGYWTLPTKAAIGALGQKADPGPSPVAYDDAVGSIEAIHRAFNQARPLTTVRVPENYRTNLRFRLGSARQTVWLEGGAYAVASRDGEEMNVKEWGFLPGCEADLLKIVPSIRAMAGDAGTVRLFGPRDPASLALWRGLAAEWRTEERPLSMVRSIAGRISDDELRALFDEPTGTHWPADDF
jgi:ribosomal protein S18 acetylase RimI-like enzyme